MLAASVALIETATTITGKYARAAAMDPLAVVTLTDRGMIKECSQALGKLLGYQPSKLIWKHISLLLPDLADIQLIKGGQINPRLHFLSRVGHRFQVSVPGAARLASNLFFVLVESSGRCDMRIIISPIGIEDTPA